MKRLCELVCVHVRDHRGKDADAILEERERYPWGGYAFFGGDPGAVRALIARLRAEADAPLLFAADLERGLGQQLAGATSFPPPMALGAAGDPGLARDVGRMTAREARTAGLNCVFAPVLDLVNEPENPIVCTRAFGESPETVAELGTALLSGLQQGGVLATAKHFPGHGDTGTDSHLQLPVISANWSRLDSVELVPFRSAVAAGVKVVMSAHIALPAIDAGRLRPGTVAPNVLTGILRDSLAFKGLVVTDALNMGGITTAYGADASVRAFLAGADLLLQPADPSAAIDAMEAAVNRGAITPERLEASLRRVLQAKLDLGLFARRTVSLDSVPAVVGSARFLGEAREMAARSVVMVKDVNGTVHGLRRDKPPITLVTFGEEENRTVGLALAAELRRQGLSLTVVRLWPGSGPASYDSAAAAIARRPVALFVAADKPTAWRGSIGLPERLSALIGASARIGPTILVSLGNPYLISRLPEVGSYLIGWRSNPVTEEAVARALAGAAPITGKLPISIPPLYHRGWGVERRISQQPLSPPPTREAT